MQAKDNCSQETAHQKINRWIEKFAVYIAMVLVSIGSFMYTKMDDKIEMLEDRVAVLYQNKVSRTELREEMALIRTSQAQMKDDIIQRLELIIRMLPPKNQR